MTVRSVATLPAVPMRQFEATNDIVLRFAPTEAGVAPASGIDVDTRNGVVTLTGSVPSPEARTTAAQLARDTDGVRRVRDRLTVTATPDSRN